MHSRMKLLGLLPIAISLASFAAGIVLVVAQDPDDNTRAASARSARYAEPGNATSQGGVWSDEDWLGTDAGATQGIPFDYLHQILGGELRYLDKEGEAHVLSMDVGKITEIDDDSLTIRLADDSAKSFDTGAGDFEKGAEVAVLAVDGEVKAVFPADFPSITGCPPEAEDGRYCDSGDSPLPITPCDFDYQLCPCTPDGDTCMEDWEVVPWCDDHCYDWIPPDTCESNSHRSGWFGYDPCITPAPSD